MLFERPSSYVAEKIIAFKNGHAAEKKMVSIWKIPVSRLKLIDWENLRAARRKMPRFEKYATTKAIYEQWHTMQMAKRNGLADTPICPLVCGKCDESWLHVFQCTEATVTVERKKNVKLMSDNLDALRTSPVLKRRINNVIRQLINAFPVTMPSDHEHTGDVADAMEVMNKLGFRHIFKGIIPREFSWIQAKYYKEEKISSNKFTGDRWAISVITMLQDFMRKSWKFRCEVLADKKTGLLEYRTRDKALELLNTLKKRPQILLQEDAHLQNRTSDYISKSPLRNVQNWVLRVECSIIDKESRSEMKQGDIRKFFRHQPTVGST